MHAFTPARVRRFMLDDVPYSRIAIYATGAVQLGLSDPAYKPANRYVRTNKRTITRQRLSSLEVVLETEDWHS